VFHRGHYGLNKGKEEGRQLPTLFCCVEITMSKGPFLPSDFTATKYSSAADKAEFGNNLLRFIESGWAATLFTKSLYNRLSMCFGHIAHYNQAQFYEEWFSSRAAQVQFLKHTLQFPCYGDPEYTFSDVERAIQRELINRNYLPAYELRLAEERQATELALLMQLESKYRTPAGEGDKEPRTTAPAVDQTRVTLIQGSLF
jgi:hypothetical protein